MTRAIYQYISDGVVTSTKDKHTRTQIIERLIWKTRERERERERDCTLWCVSSRRITVLLYQALSTIWNLCSAFVKLWWNRRPDFFPPSVERPSYTSMNLHDVPGWFILVHGALVLVLRRCVPQHHHAISQQNLTGEAAQPAVFLVKLVDKIVLLVKTVNCHILFGFWETAWPYFNIAQKHSIQVSGWYFMTFYYQIQ